VTFELLPHTADIKIALQAADLGGLYQAAADALRFVIVGDSVVEERETVTLMPDGEGDDERFFRFVRELAYRFDVDGFLPSRLVAMNPPRVAGERFDGLRHTYERQVKAVTRHQYALSASAAGYRAELVLDL
jgi:SHS2 domain-containing protein